MFTPQIQQAMEERFIRDPEAADRPRHLTPRHREIVQMLAEGQSAKEIASILDLNQDRTLPQVRDYERAWAW